MKIQLYAKTKLTREKVFPLRRKHLLQKEFNNKKGWPWAAVPKQGSPMFEIETSNFLSL
jgi:hypothetical protein